ncbi:2',3'-cyclic-nucleotide 3'-phosphodiesterase [Paramyrothecium foliicola]|nr:2',3'-cyclic-nucleotide 3'-phosphodiesterase [Paramyrothecium foliicola]
MPGSSLWLIPPADHPLHRVLGKLICTQLPAKFPELTGPQFDPHMTLTSNISPAVYGDSPQQWLDSIPWPSGKEVQVRFETVETEDTFFRRGTIKVNFDGVRDVAGIARARGVVGEEAIGPVTEEWLKEWKSAFGPHVSLIYGSVPISDTKLAEITDFVKSNKIHLSPDSTADDEFAGWKGGEVWLVPTDRSIEQWKPIVIKKL